MAWSRCGSRAALAALAAMAMALALAMAQKDGNRYKKCVREDKNIGYCVPDSMCFENLTINTGGDIPDGELRIDDSPIPESECGDLMWCCEKQTDTPEPRPDTTPAPRPETTSAPKPDTTPAPRPETTPVPGPGSTLRPGFNTSNCLLYYGECPWCAAIYRRGGDVLRGHRLESGLYCAGALLAPRVLLTSGTCVRTVGLEKVWARVPAAADPAHHYAVVENIVHPEYNSGTRENDIGLFVLEEEVRWPSDPVAACVGTGSLTATNCVVVGFDNNEEITTTEMSVTDGDCPGRRRRRQQPDLACGFSSEDKCNVKQGAPVLCPAPSDGQGGREIVGVARTSCGHTTRKALLTKLQPHEGWLRGQLQRLGAPLLHHVP